MKRTKGSFLIAGACLATTFGIMKVVAQKRTEDVSIDDDNPYLSSPVVASSDSEKVVKEGLCDGKKASGSIYERKVKSVLDQVLSFLGLILGGPIFGAIALAIKIDDPGPVFFTQKRIGKDKHYFMCHKFRSMRMSTPHDMPTHMLSNPDTYITRVGRVLRKTSLDELPQIWDIFRGRMSVIGPRPALWNQDDLVAERDKYSANSVMPGLTGLAQINGRDELEIAEKAAVDGEYTKALRAGGIKGFRMDLCCFFDTVKSVLKQEGVVEGGTGKRTDN